MPALYLNMVCGYVYTFIELIEDSIRLIVYTQIFYVWITCVCTISTIESSTNRCIYIDAIFTVTHNIMSKSCSVCVLLETVREEKAASINSPLSEMRVQI